MNNEQIIAEIHYLREQLDRGVRVRVFWKIFFAIILAQISMAMLGFAMFLALVAMGIASMAAGANQAAQERVDSEQALWDQQEAEWEAGREEREARRKESDKIMEEADRIQRELFERTMRGIANPRGEIQDANDSELATDPG